MRIVADQNIPALDETFGQFGELRCVNGREITASDLSAADVLLVRSVTRVDRNLLESSPVQFIGTATIGTDHLDIPYLEQSGRHWCYAPGCNADAAAQYTLAMIMLATRRADTSLAQLRVGIVGVGNVGSRVQKLLVAAGVQQVLACDPPLAEKGQAGLASFEDLLSCDLISFHVPLTHAGPHATWQMGNDAFFSSLKPGTGIINSSRGAVLDGQVLAEWLSQDQGYAALDVWPDEPDIDLDLMERVTVATPHVAGYSLEGKLNGTRMLLAQFLDWQGLEHSKPLPPIVPTPEPTRCGAGAGVEDLVLACCPVRPG